MAKPRFIAGGHKVQPSERPHTLFVYWVTGRGQFPYDMLRHDACWPAKSNDADKLDWHGMADYNAQRSICMYSWRAPTVDRWSSFLWSVGTEELKHGQD